MRRSESPGAIVILQAGAVRIQGQGIPIMAHHSRPSKTIFPEHNEVLAYDISHEIKRIEAPEALLQLEERNQEQNHMQTSEHSFLRK